MPLRDGTFHAAQRHFDLLVYYDSGKKNQYFSA